MASIEQRKNEVAEKVQLLRKVMVIHQIDSILLAQLPNIAWLTAGASTFINLASDVGPVKLYITLKNAYAITDNIEAPRIEQEENLGVLGFTILIDQWNKPGLKLRKVLSGTHHGQDGPGAGKDLSSALQMLRSHLLPQEVERLRHVGALASDAINDVMLAIVPGMTEIDVATLLAAASVKRGGLDTVNLVASDDRISRFRHPLPTQKIIERYVMVVLCLRYEGLIAAVTRFIHFGFLPNELAAKELIVATIDAKLIHHTQSGLSMSDMFAFAQEAYQDAGYPGAAEEHHQGGSIAYMPREILLRPDEPTTIDIHQAFAWNPSIPGVKSEDTIILSESGQEIITATTDWPTLAIPIEEQIILRPAIKVL